MRTPAVTPGPPPRARLLPRSRKGSRGTWSLQDGFGQRIPWPASNEAALPKNSLPAPDQVRLVDGLPHHQHLVGHKPVHHEQLPVVAGVKGLQLGGGHPHAHHPDTYVGGGRQPRLLQAHAQVDVVDGEELDAQRLLVDGVAGVAGHQQPPSPAVGRVRVGGSDLLRHVVLAPLLADGTHVGDEVAHKEVLVPRTGHPQQVLGHVVSVGKDIIVPIEDEADARAAALQPSVEEHLLEGEVEEAVHEAPLQDVAVLGVLQAQQLEDAADVDAGKGALLAPGLADDLPALVVVRGGLDGQQQEDLVGGLGGAALPGQVKQQREGPAVPVAQEVLDVVGQLSKAGEVGHGGVQPALGKRLRGLGGSGRGGPRAVGHFQEGAVLGRLEEEEQAAEPDQAEDHGLHFMAPAPWHRDLEEKAGGRRLNPPPGNWHHPAASRRLRDTVRRAEASGKVHQGAIKMLLSCSHPALSLSPHRENSEADRLPPPTARAHCADKERGPAAPGESPRSASPSPGGLPHHPPTGTRCSSSSPRVGGEGAPQRVLLSPPSRDSPGQQNPGPKPGSPQQFRLLLPRGFVAGRQEGGQNRPWEGRPRGGRKGGCLGDGSSVWG
ncbi:hypothetical protein E2320_022147 [Naja naja]|nr:hypothetical protein E2320_022147 [Naja naja]